LTIKERLDRIKTLEELREFCAELEEVGVPNILATQIAYGIPREHWSALVDDYIRRGIRFEK